MAMTAQSTQVRQPGWVAWVTGSAERYFAVFCAAHVILGVAAYQSSLLSTLHGAATFGIVLWLAAMKGSLVQIAYGLAYLIGGEILWRMTDARLPWEFGKYAVIAIMGIGLLRTQSTRVPVLAVLFMLLLLPSVILTLTAVSLAEARDTISFNLSGPLTLFISCWFFSQVRLSRHQLRTLLLCMIAPITSVATITLFVMLRASNLRFTSESNFALSGGYGPNQVSLILGLGGLLVWFFLLTLPASRRFRVFLGALGAWFFIHGVLTFSRGGVSTAAIVIAAVTLQGMSNAKQRRTGLIYVTLMVVAVIYFLPQLDQFTQGQLTNRYTENSLSHRDDVVMADWEIFLMNPVWGVGPGMATTNRLALVGRDLPAHTEFTRLASEHGALGLLAIAVMGGIALQRLAATRRSAIGRGFVIACLLWSLLSMTHAAMRLAVIPVFFGLSYLTILDEGTEEENPVASIATADGSA